MLLSRANLVGQLSMGSLKQSALTFVETKIMHSRLFLLETVRENRPQRGAGLRPWLLPGLASIMSLAIQCVLPFSGLAETPLPSPAPSASRITTNSIGMPLAFIPAGEFVMGSTQKEADEFIEQISYRETRDYVKKVLGNQRRYQQLYGGAHVPGS